MGQHNIPNNFRINKNNTRYFLFTKPICPEEQSERIIVKSQTRQIN